MDYAVSTSSLYSRYISPCPIHLQSSWLTSTGRSCFSRTKPLPWRVTFWVTRILPLTDEIPLGLNAETSVGRLTMDLSGLDLEEVNATVAVGALEITLDPQDVFEGRLSNPVGEIKINIPDGALVELMLDTAIAGENYPDDYVKIGDALYSPGATAENARIRLRVEKPIGLVSIDGIE